MFDFSIIIWTIVVLLVLLIASTSIKTIRPTDRGLVERFGKYHRFAPPGLALIIPLGIERLTRINITEMMVDAGGRKSSPRTA
jgi:regulator of protease activity HflC (stomatin/prohibitin superfamily)